VKTPILLVLEVQNDLENESFGFLLEIMTFVWIDPCTGIVLS
jgi:hypothetical protein